jgi:hypothetical protein
VARYPILRINGVGVWLRDLAPDRGRKHEEPNMLAEADICAAGLV